jgi:hypothetical protein
MVLTFAGRATFKDVLDLTPANPACTGSPLECTIRVDVSPGVYSASIYTYDQAPVGGNIPTGAGLLSSALGISVSVARGTANTFSITLDGVPGRIVVSGFPDATAGTSFLSKPFSVTVEDADGYVIVGTYATPITLVDGDTSGATAIATSGTDDPPALQLLSSADAAAIGYNGAAIAPVKISAEAGTVKSYGTFAVHLPAFVADSGNAAVKEVPPGCASSGCVTAVGASFTSPQGVAVDSSGNVFVADQVSDFGGEVKKVPPNCFSVTCITTIGGGFTLPSGPAADGSGNVFVADTLQNVVDRIPNGCLTASCVVPIGGGFNAPEGVAVDAAGDVIVADAYNGAVKKMASGCQSSACVTTMGGGFFYPWGVAVDLFGNVFVADEGDSAVKEIPPGCQSSACVISLGGGFSYPRGVTVDGFGDVFVVDDTGALKEVPPGCSSAACVVTFSLGFNSPRGIAML